MNLSKYVHQTSWYTQTQTADRTSLLVGGQVKLPELQSYLGCVDRVVSSLHRRHPRVVRIESDQFDFCVNVWPVEVLR